MAFKIASLVVDISAETKNFSSATKVVSASVSKLGSDLKSTFDKKVVGAIRGTSNEMQKFSDHSKSAIKEVSRVVSGILISQAFHRLVRAIREGISAVIDFSLELEKVEIAFTNLFKGSEEQASAFLSKLEDLASVTPIQFDPIRKASQQLLAMRVEAEDVIPVMSVLVDTISGIGGTEQQLASVTDVISRIIGRGTISARDVLSLSRLRIPISEILREQLGLSFEDIGNIGRLKIPAGKAVQAILTGLQGEFGGLSKKMSRTLSGLISTMKDNLLFIGKELFEPIRDRLRIYGEEVVEKLQMIRVLVKREGFKGMFETLIPGELQGALKTLARGFRILRENVKQFVAVIGPSMREAIVTTIGVIGVLFAKLGNFIGWLTNLTRAFKETGFGAYFLYFAFTKLFVIASISQLISAFIFVMKKMSIITGVTKAIQALTKAFAGLKLVLATHPVLIIIGLVAGAIALVALNSEWARNKIQGLIDKFKALVGVTGSVQKALNEAVNSPLEDAKFDLSDINGGFENMESGINGVNNAMKKFTLSFDEVFSPPDQTSGGGGGGFFGALDDQMEDMIDRAEEFRKLHGDAGLTPEDFDLGTTGVDTDIDFKPSISDIAMQAFQKDLEIIKKAWEELKGHWQQFLNDLEVNWKQFWNNLRNAWNSFKMEMHANWVRFTTRISDAWEEMKEKISRAWHEMVDPIIELIKRIKENWDAMMEKFREAKQKFEEGDILGAFKTIFEGIWEFISDTIEDFKELGPEIVKAIINFIPSVITAVIQFGADFVGAVGDFISDTVTSFINLGSDIAGAIGGFWDGVKTSISTFLGNITKTFKETFDALIDNAWYVVNAIASIFEGAEVKPPSYTGYLGLGAEGLAPYTGNGLKAPSSGQTGAEQLIDKSKIIKNREPQVTPPPPVPEIRSSDSKNTFIVADNTSMRQWERRMNVIETKEDTRKGFNSGR